MESRMRYVRSMIAVASDALLGSVGAVQGQGPFTFDNPAREVYCQLSDLTLTLNPNASGGGQGVLTFAQDCNSSRSDRPNIGPWLFSVPVYRNGALVYTFSFYYS